MKNTVLRGLTVVMFAILLVAPALGAQKQVTLTVDGLDCASAEVTVNRILGNAKGVSSVAIDMDEGTAKFSLDSQSGDIDAIKAAIEDEAFPVLKIEGL